VPRPLAVFAAAASLSIFPVFLGASAAPADAWARPKPAKTCKAAGAKAAEVNVVAAHGDDFDGKCVRLTGWWRGAAIYPTRAEAAQPDAVTMSFLDRRRVGLYLDPKDSREPDEPTYATVVGTVGLCSRWSDDVRLHGEGYCQRKPGPYLAAVQIDPQ
jgi:hypothetical protein